MIGTNDRYWIVGLRVSGRMKKAGMLQKVLSEFGCQIRTRIGLHHVDTKYCSPNGVVLLDLFGEEKVCRKMVAQLKAIPGVEVKMLTFGPKA